MKYSVPAILSVLILQSFAGKVCLSSEEQNTVCPNREVMSDCNGHCQATCANPNPICTRICSPGCVCPAGELRNSAGNCVPSDECPPNVTVAPQKCEANSVWANCVQGCNDCMFFTNNMIACDPVPLKYCKPGCACVAGYRKDDKGKCVKETECPGYKPDPEVCPKNQVWSQCGMNGCQSCGVDPTVCKPGCFAPGCTCAEGYKRNAAGDCVLLAQCPAVNPPPKPVCPTNEVYSDCNAGCQNDCSGFLKPCAKICRAGCICAPGFTRDQNNKNICVKKCPVIVTPPTPAPGTCKANEFWAPCPSGCSACRFFTDRRIACDPARTCTPGCACVAGYRKDNAGLCVKETECPGYTPKPTPATTPITTLAPNDCPANQVWSDCGINHCQDCGVNPLVCKPACNPPGCTCADGYRRNADGDCVLPEECPGETTPEPHECGVNEFWGPCGHNSCENCLVYLQQAACRPFCTPGCQCLDGYRRNDAGVCIPEIECQAEQICPANEVYDKCYAGCQATCAGPFIRCPKICRAGCVCEPGYVREKAGGDCIEISECPATTPKPSTQCSALEEFSQCGARCQSTCDNPNPLVCVLICAPGCVCKKPFVRAADNKCVLQSQCPPKCTEPNQVYSTCINSCMTCDVLTNQRPCDPLPEPECSKGCTCADGYRSASGNCVLASQCPPRNDPWAEIA